MDNVQEEIVYPHRRVLLGKQQCDVCNNKGVQFISVNNKEYTGFWTCGDQSCIQQIKYWINRSIISNNLLIEELGDIVYVRRSNNRKELGWTIEGDAYQEEKGGHFWVIVRNNKKHQSKCVTLEKLRDWNNLK
jgi:hypothetical protein